MGRETRTATANGVEVKYFCVSLSPGRISSGSTGRTDPCYTSTGSRVQPGLTALKHPALQPFQGEFGRIGDRHHRHHARLTGSLTTRSAASGTLPAMFRLITSKPSWRTSRTACFDFAAHQRSGQHQRLALGRRATARTASASACSPTSGMVSTEMCSPRMLCRSASEPRRWPPAPPGPRRP